MDGFGVAWLTEIKAARSQVKQIGGAVLAVRPRVRRLISFERQVVGSIDDGGFTARRMVVIAGEAQFPAYLYTCPGMFSMT